MNKKIIASMLALLVAFSAGAAFAENETEEKEEVSVTATADSEDAEKEDIEPEEEDKEVEDEASEEVAEDEELLIAPAPQEGEEAAEETGKILTLTLDENRITDGNDAVTEIDVAPCVMDGKVMIPFRAVFEALGAVISWDAETSTVFAVKNEDVFVLQIGQDVMYVNSERVELDAPTVIVNDRTLISVDSVSKALDCNAEYSEDNKTIVIG